MKHIFIIGSKGIPAKYGGFETFVEKLTKYRRDEQITYHVACQNADKEEYNYNNAHCFSIKVPNIGPAKAVYYDVCAFNYCLKYIKQNNIKDTIIYVLACRIGPFIGRLKKKANYLGGHLYVNPDGHEWKRAKWNFLIRKYWKYSERLMVKNAELLICDSKNIQKYIQEEYKKYNPKTTYIAYGADVAKSKINDQEPSLQEWYREKGIEKDSYYLIVGRFVKENNYETIIREFLKSNTNRQLAIITNVENNKFYKELIKNTHCLQDNRIRFVGTVYNQEMLKKIRENAYGYFHGHEVGGTNPSLLEALGSTDLNILLDVGFNKEVGEDAVVYWTKENGNLSQLIDRVDKMSVSQRKQLGTKAKNRIKDAYSWEYIIEEYEKVFNYNELRG